VVMSKTKPELEHIVAGLSGMMHTLLNRTNTENPVSWSLFLSVQVFYIKKPFDYKTKTSKYPFKHEKLESSPPSFQNNALYYCTSNEDPGSTENFICRVINKKMKKKRS